MRIQVQRYESDGNINIRRGNTNFTIDQVRLVGNLEEVKDVLMWEFLGHGDSLSDVELEGVAKKVMSEL